MDPFTWTCQSWLTNKNLPVDTGCNLEDLLGAMDNRYGWQERVGEIDDFIYIYIYILQLLCFKRKNLISYFFLLNSSEF